MSRSRSESERSRDQTCSVCFESIESRGEIKRGVDVPCGGIICRNCVDDVLDCPECGEQHSAHNLKHVDSDFVVRDTGVDEGQVCRSRS